MVDIMKAALLVLAVFGPFLAGCASQEFRPVEDPSVRIDGDGFSVLPPPGPGWRRGPDVNSGGSRGISFVRQGTPGSTTHTVAASVVRHTGFNPAAVGFADYARKPEVFAAYVKSAAEHNNPPGGRMKILEMTVTPDTQLGYGARQHARFEDRGYSSQVLVQDDWSLSCLHPGSDGVIVEIVFSERGRADEQDPSLAQVREQFFSSVQFRPLR